MTAKVLLSVAMAAFLTAITAAAPHRRMDFSSAVAYFVASAVTPRGSNGVRRRHCRKPPPQSMALFGSSPSLPSSFSPHSLSFASCDSTTAPSNVIPRGGVRKSDFQESDDDRQRRLRRRIDALVRHPAVTWTESSSFSFKSMHGKRLGRRHISLFDNDDDSSECEDPLFNEFARTICRAGVLRKKELFETWAMALHVHEAFLTDEDDKDKDERRGRGALVRRVADIAAGHGLLAWALLVLDDEYRWKDAETTRDGVVSDGDDENIEKAPRTCRPLTALCLDIKTPPAAEALRTSVLDRWPDLDSRFDYVEGRLECLVPHRTCLLVSVHACGSLSDALVSLSAKWAVPLAVVPCCHSRKKKALMSASPFASEEYDAVLKWEGSFPDLADRLDGARVAALTNAGFGVAEDHLPAAFTAKNRLILGFPPPEPVALPDAPPPGWISPPTTNPSRKQRMPPLFDSDVATPVAIEMANLKSDCHARGFAVPCRDIPSDRAAVSKLAGRAAADRRKAAVHERVPRFDVSIWLPPKEEDAEGGGVSTAITERALSDLVRTIKPGIIDAAIEMAAVPYVHPKTGRVSQLFRIHYCLLAAALGELKEEDLAVSEDYDGGKSEGDERRPAPFGRAKEFHARLRDLIPMAFPGAECR